MSIHDSLPTSVTLLARIREDQSDGAAWCEFTDRYGSRIYAWCVNRRLQPADAEDVTQNVLLKLARHIRAFEYDANFSFRGWLRRITENAVTDFFRERKAKGGGNMTGFESLEAAEATRDLVERLTDAFDLELLDTAKTRVRQRVDARRWKAWEMVAIEQISGEEVAKKLDMKLPTVYSSRYQVQKMISDEVKTLESDSEKSIASA